MKYPTLSIVLSAAAGCALLALSSAHAQTPQAPTGGPAAPPGSSAPPPPSPEQLSYWLGVQYSVNLKSLGVGSQLVPEQLTRGFKDGVAGKTLSAAEQQQMQAYVQQAMRDAVKHNVDAGKAFLDAKSKEKGVVKTASGLEYRILSTGDKKAAPILPSDEVTVHYSGKLIDGSEFDSSYTRGTPATFRVDGVIRGWQEALVLMKPGAKWELFVPTELGYGYKQTPGIPPGSVLVFQVELISVKRNDAPALGAPAGQPKSK